MSWKRQKQDKDEMTEECCFICKDSGHDLRVCDSRNCPKAYHPRCFQNKDEVFICDWHTCVHCRGRSDYQCLCCPFYSVCSACLGKLEFVQLRKQNKGFCSSCLNLAIAIEKDDPHVSKTDNYKILFKDYWEGIKDAEHLTLVDLEEASDILNRKLNCKGATLERFPADDHKLDENTSPDNGANDQTRFPADDLKTHENTSPDNGANDQTISFDSEGKQIKANTSRNNKSNKRTYVGWGSKELIGFLSSLGKDTSKSLDELEIIGVVKGYIKQKKLYQDDKKLRFLCDDKLQPLFTRRKVRCKMIRKFLAVHLASNAISEDERFCSYEDDDDALVIKKRPRNSLGPKIAKRVSERSKRHFASLTQNNINLIYLRKTLVISLLNQPDTFEQKVIGCFVRVRCGKKTHSYEIPKKAYLLGKVIGIKKSKNEYKINDTYTKILLCVTGLLDDVSVSMLSDEDLEEDECDDLISLAEKGLLERATVEGNSLVHRDEGPRLSWRKRWQLYIQT
eukprot:XP_020405986.1 zinc finger CCCH domain-containing protein 44 isoform X3 [Zea mays]